jgi:xylulokinase
MSWLGLDLGTSSLKAAVVGDDGRLLGVARASYPTHAAGAVVEQDARDYDGALAAVLQDLGDHLPGVEGVGLVGQTPTLVLVDDHGEPVAPAIVWRDARAAAEAGELEARFGAGARPLVGMDLPWSPSFPPARLLWLAHHASGVQARTRWVLQPKDFLGHRLTGAIASDPWSSKGLCDVRTSAPATELLAALGWSDHVVPPIRPAWEPLGAVRAAAHGLRAGVPVSVGWSDALAGMLAVGAFDAPTAFVISGTSDIAGISAHREPVDSSGLLSIPSTCAPLPVVYGPTQSSGGSVDWWARILGVEPDDLVALAAKADGSAPVFTPYLAGERAPLWNDTVRGALMGLDAGHGRAELARGVLLGVALSGRHVLDTAAERLGAPFAEVRTAGRDALDDTWAAIRRTTLGVPVRRLAHPDPSCLGAAMLGALASGRSAEDLVLMRGEMRLDEPSAGERRAATTLFERYLEAARLSMAFAG